MSADSPLSENPPKIRLPRYEQIASKLIRDIRSGTIPAGAKLPSEAELQQQFSVSRVTMRQALGVLEYQGWIQRFRRKGSFVTGEGGDGGRNRELTDDQQGGLSIVQFFHSGFAKSEAHPFSRGEVEAAERYYAQRGIAVVWNALDFRALLQKEPPPAVRSGACLGILLDGHLSELHVEIVRRWKRPFVVLGEHELGGAAGEVHLVAPDIPQTAALAIEAMDRLGVAQLLAFDNGLTNVTHRRVLMELDAQLAAAGRPPLALLPLAAGLRPGFLRQVDRLGRRCGLYVSSMELTNMLMAVMQDDKDWKRHPFIAQGPPFPSHGPQVELATWIEMPPQILVEEACRVLDELVDDPSLPPRVIRLPGRMKLAAKDDAANHPPVDESVKV